MEFASLVAEISDRGAVQCFILFADSQAEHHEQERDRHASRATYWTKVKNEMKTKLASMPLTRPPADFWSENPGSVAGKIDPEELAHFQRDQSELASGQEALAKAQREAANIQRDAADALSKMNQDRAKEQRDAADAQSKLDQERAVFNEQLASFVAEKQALEEKKQALENERAQLNQQKAALEAERVAHQKDHDRKQSESPIKLTRELSKPPVTEDPLPLPSVAEIAPTPPVRAVQPTPPMRPSGLKTEPNTPVVAPPRVMPATAAVPPLKRPEPAAVAESPSGADSGGLKGKLAFFNANLNLGRPGVPPPRLGSRSDLLDRTSIAAAESVTAEVAVPIPSVAAVAPPPRRIMDAAAPVVPAPVAQESPGPGRIIAPPRPSGAVAPAPAKTKGSGKFTDSHAIALFDFKEAPPNDFCCTFAKGDICKVVEDKGEWLKVRFLEETVGVKREGYVPANFFDPCVAPRRAKALFDFEKPKPEGFVQLKANDIMIVEIGGPGDEWWVVKRAGAAGYVPSNRVQEITD